MIAPTRNVPKMAPIAIPAFCPLSKADDCIGVDDGAAEGCGDAVDVPIGSAVNIVTSEGGIVEYITVVPDVERGMTDDGAVDTEIGESVCVGRD